MGREPISSDGGQWRLAWEQRDDGHIRAWVVTEPDIEVIRESWEQAREDLCHRIDDELQAGEWTADWLPPAPFEDGDRAWIDPTYIRLVAEGRHHAFNNPHELFEGGVCPGCMTPRGARRDNPLATYVEIPGGIVMSGSAGHPQIMHIATVQALTPARLGEARPWQVRDLANRSSSYVELVAPQVIPLVQLKAPAKYMGWQCAICGHRQMSHVCGGDYLEFIAASTVPAGVESFWINPASPSLCVRQDWWQANRLRPEFDGVISNRLPVIADDQIELNPTLPVHDRRDRALPSLKSKVAHSVKYFGEHRGLIVPEKLIAWTKEP